jgi:FKBP-type peptidyl-prolyl cis-trans isomerase FkpA
MLGGFVSVALLGCEDPGPIVPVTPPGAVLPRENPDTETPVAKGEMAAPVSATAAADSASADYTPATPTAKGETKTTAHGVKYETIREGTGAELKLGQTARFQYVGTLDDGTVFDTTRKTGQPVSYVVAANKLIEGWVEALPGMKVGEIRKLTVPPEQGYGARGHGADIPPNATLHFEVELIDIL